MIVFRRVPVLRGITAAHVPADQAEAEVHPLIARLQALLAPFLLVMPEMNLVEMFAGRRHDLF